MGRHRLCLALGAALVVAWLTPFAGANENIDLQAECMNLCYSCVKGTVSVECAYLCSLVCDNPFSSEKPTPKGPAAPKPTVTTTAACAAKAGSYRVVRTYRKAGHTVPAGTCQACVSRLSAYNDTVVPGRTVCYKSVTNAAGTGCVKATALVIPLTSLQRPQQCLPDSGTSHMMLLATSSQFSLAHLKAVNVASLRLAGLGQSTTGISVKRNAHTLKLTFNDPQRIIARARGSTLLLTGYAKDAPTGLNVCFTASVLVC